MGDFRRVLRYLYPYKKESIIATVLVAFVVVADLSIPRMVQVIIDDGVAKGDMNVILWTSLLMIGASVLSAAISIANTYYSV